MFFFFFFDNEKKLKDKQIELHYLSNTISYGKEKNDGNEFFDSYGVLEKQNSKDESDNEFKESDFKRLISEKIRKTIYGGEIFKYCFSCWCWGICSRRQSKLWKKQLK